MSKYPNFAVAMALCVSVGAWTPVLAEPQQDLEHGRAALEAGDMETALTLLAAAAEAMPQSVEAQLLLGRAQLHNGDLDAALRTYRRILTLSPDHAEAQRIVDGLLHSGKRLEQRLAAARRLIDAGAQREAQQLLRPLIATPRRLEEDAAVRLALTESLLLSGQPAAALQEAAWVIATAGDTPAARHAHILAALAVLESTDADRRLELAEAHLAEAEPVEEPRFEPLRRVAQVLIEIEKPGNTLEVAEATHLLLADHVLDPLLSRQVLKVTERLMMRAGDALAAGQPDRAMGIVWCVLTGHEDGPPAGADPFEIDLDAALAASTPTAAEARRLMAEAFVRTGRYEISRRGHAGSPAGYAIAVQVLMFDPSRPRSLELAVDYVRDLGNLSRPEPRRGPGDELSSADRLQRELAATLMPLLTTPAQQSQLAAAMIEQLDRFDKAEDLVTGLRHFVTAAEDEQQPRFHGPLSQWPEHAAMRRLVETIAGHYRRLGDQVLAEHRAAMAPRDAHFLADEHRLALMLDAWSHQRFPAEATLDAGLATVHRYGRDGAWPAAERALALLLASADPRDRQWPAIELALMRGEHEEVQLLESGRRLPDQLLDAVAEGLDSAVVALRDDDRTATQQRVERLGTRLVNRYQQLTRRDLAEAVIDRLDQQPVALGAWALWMRSRLAGREADIELQRVLAKSPDDIPDLTAAHGVERDLLYDLAGRFAESPYRKQAIDRIFTLESTYRRHRAFEVARQMISGLQQVDADLAGAEAPAWRLVTIAMARHDDALKREMEDRPADTVPEALLAESDAAIEQIAAFLEAHPQGPHTRDVQQQLLALAAAYGRVDAWPVAREVIDRFAALRPDHRMPGYLDLLRAATWLGQLDTKHGLALLHWQPTAEAPRLPWPDGQVPPGDLSDTDSWIAGTVRDGVEMMVPGRAPVPAAEADIDPAVMGYRGPVGRGGADRAGRFDDEVARSGERALAMIRRSEQAQASRIAALREGAFEQRARVERGEMRQAPILRDDAVLAEQELRRQDEAAEGAYAILVELAGRDPVEHAAVAAAAREQLLWLIGFFEGQNRADRAIALIERMLDDLPDDPARLALAFRAIEAQMKQAAHRREGETIDWAWLNDRHEQFEVARRAARAFARSHAERPGGLPWARRAWALVIDSFETEAALAAAVSPVRAGGLRLRQSRELTALLERDPDHPAVAQMAGRLFSIAERIAMLEQRDAAIQVLNQVPVRFPDDAHAPRAMLRIAQLYAAELASPLRAVETYQEYLALTGTDVSSEVYQIARNLAGQDRYVEALHVYGVFVDSFPRDARAAEALLAIGSIHQTNRAWAKAMVAYQRILREYPDSNVLASARLAIADCHINLSQWTEAQRAYERFVEHHESAPQTALARQRIELLKHLARFQDLLADERITRMKDDAQFQIGRIVLERLENPIKAIDEFEKVVAHYPESQWADNAQLEIGKALLGLNRLDEARRALLKLVELYPNSALADRALYLVGRSYEQEAERLAAATSPAERQRLALGRQQEAYRQVQGMNVAQDQRLAERRAGLVREGRFEEAELQEAYGTFRFRGDNVALEQFARIAEIEAERESALQIANRQDRINEAYRSAAEVYLRAATDYPLGERTAEALLRAAEILQAKLNDHDTAMATYQRIVEFFPASPTAEDAAWKVAQHHQRQGEHARAVEAYRDFIRKYPASGRVPEALFATAEVLEQLDRWIEAMDAYETFTRRFPDHPRAAMATEQVNWIKAYRR